MKKITILCILLLCAVINAMAQQAITVSGVVADSNKEPLIGVNITVKDVPGLGAITDVNGKYTIKIEPYNRLVFSYIGFKTQEVLIKEQRSVNIKMEEDVATAIDEVVITGTGAQRKLVQTGAITTVDVEHLMANPRVLPLAGIYQNARSRIFCVRACRVGQRPKRKTIDRHFRVFVVVL